jgi:RimJ/RimL family protein N-acetyltransferase
MSVYPIEIHEMLCNGDQVYLCWPDFSEFDEITMLRNKPNVRDSFLDNRTLNAEQNRKWLESKMERPKEALLSIRLKNNDCFLGTIGWSDWNIEMKTACFGRLMVNHEKIKHIKHLLPDGYVGIALDACFALRDFAMTTMGIEFLRTYLFVNNQRAKKVNLRIGLEEVGRSVRQRVDGSNIETIEMLLTREKWKKIKQL